MESIAMTPVEPHDLQEQLVRKWRMEDWTETALLDQCNTMSDEPLIVIGGCARSGTTLTRVTLDSHSELVIGPPTNVFIPTSLDLNDISFRLALKPNRVSSMAELSEDRISFIEALSGEC